MEVIRFVLKEEQIEHLQKNYKDHSIIQQVFSSKKQDLFKVPRDVFVPFWYWLVEKTVTTLKNDEPTQETYMFEDIVDFLAVQDQNPEWFTSLYDEIEQEQ